MAKNVGKSLDSSETEDNEGFIPGYKDLNEFSQSAFKAIMGAIKSSNDLPSSGDDFDYYSSFESFRNLMDIEGIRILELIQQFMRYHGARGNLAKAEGMDLEERFDTLVDANDQFLERVGTFLDEASGLRKEETPLVIATMKGNKPIVGSWNRKSPGSSKTVSKGASFRLLAAKNIQRPQHRFKDKIDNSSRPFIPKIKHKPNALKQLHESLLISDELIHSEDYEENFEFPHPYQYELDQLSPPAWQLQKGNVQEPVPLDNCQETLIDCKEDLISLVKTLKSEREIAVDVEHHSYRTFQGITCLLQLSTRQKDYLLDTLELRSDLHLLNEVFTNPKIVKVFHGADLDVEWLQRDLGLYVVNMFDTGQAARVLNLQRFSLAHSLAHYCQVEADKQYQLADWRIRPLPEALVKYAREDTHYLLYIYDRMRTELIDRGNDQNNLLLSVLQRSKDICAKRYKKPQFSPKSYMEMYKKSKKVFNSQQLTALKGLYTWRDSLARVEDESLGYVLPNHMLMQICEILPREPQGVLACCNPIPPLVRQNLNEIHVIVREAREQPMKKEEPLKTSFKPTRLQHPKYNVDYMLNSPHDASHASKTVTMAENVTVPVARTSTMYSDKSGIHICNVQVKQSPVLSVFAHQSEAMHLESTDAQKKAAQIRNSFNNPLEKFIPMSILEKAGKKITSTTDILQKEDQWKLLPETKRSAPKPKVVSVLKATVAKEDMIAVADIDDNAEPSQSVRQQYPKGQKRPSDSHEEIQLKKPKEETSSVHNRNQPNEGKKSKFMVPQEDFKAYDYSDKGYSMFDAKGSSKNKDYNPDSQNSGAKHKSGSKGKHYSAGNKKSMTYNKDKSGSSSKIQWPKR